MIVTCQKCETSFQLDEARVPLEGIRVRCSRCKEAFFLPHPSSTAADVADQVAAEAAQAEGVPTPGATTDLGASAAEPAMGDDAGGFAAGGPAAGANEGGTDDEESDWEFNHEPPADLSAGQDEGFDVSAFGSVGEEGVSGLDLDESGAPADPSRAGSLELASGSDEGPAIGESAAEETPFGAEGLGVAGLDGEGPGGAGLAAEAASETEPGDAAHEAASGLAAEGDEAAGELGDPENWDLFGDECLEHSPLNADAGSGERARLAIARTQLVPQGSLEDESSDQTNERAAAVNPISGPGAFDVEGAEPLASPVLRSLAVAGHTVGWAATIGLAVLALATGLSYTTAPFVAGERSLEVAGFRAQDVRTEWIDTLGAGTLLVVTGQLESPHHVARVGDTPLQAVLLAADGTPLEVEPAPLGSSLPEAALRELSSEALWRARRDAAAEFAARRVGPGNAGYFQALFADVPGSAVRLALQPAVTSGAPAEL